MDPNGFLPQEERAPLAAYADVASRLELALTHPALREEEVDAACHRAVAMGLAAVLVRPCDVDMAVRILGETTVATSSVVGFPHGYSNTATKLYEGRDLIRRGARELSFVVNYGKMISRQFRHVETELEQISESCRQAGVALTLTYESGYLGEDHKVILCKMAKRIEAAYLATNNAADLPLLRTIGKDFIKLKSSGPNLEHFRAAYAGGCERFSSSAALPIAAEWKASLTAAT